MGISEQSLLMKQSSLKKLVGQFRVFVLLIKPDAFWILSSLNRSCGCANFAISTTYKKYINAKISQSLMILCLDKLGQ